jgi:hypothetical protein
MWIYITDFGIYNDKHEWIQFFSMSTVVYEKKLSKKVAHAILTEAELWAVSWNWNITIKYNENIPASVMLWYKICIILSILKDRHMQIQINLSE